MLLDSVTATVLAIKELRALQPLETNFIALCRSPLSAVASAYPEYLRTHSRPWTQQSSQHMYSISRVASHRMHDSASGYLVPANLVPANGVSTSLQTAVPGRQCFCIGLTAMKASTTLSVTRALAA